MKSPKEIFQHFNLNNMNIKGNCMLINGNGLIGDMHKSINQLQFMSLTMSDLGIITEKYFYCDVTIKILVKIYKQTHVHTIRWMQVMIYFH